MPLKIRRPEPLLKRFWPTGRVGRKKDPPAGAQKILAPVGSIRSESMLYFILSICLIVIDQLVKWWVRASIPLGTSIPFLPCLMDLTYTQNTGAAFSSFAGLTWLLALVSLIATVVIALLLRRDFFPSPLGRFTLALLLSGAAGNLIDRVFLGFVTDMFQTTFIKCCNDQPNCCPDIFHPLF